MTLILALFQSRLYHCKADKHASSAQMYRLDASFPLKTGTMPDCSTCTCRISHRMLTGGGVEHVQD